MSLADEESTFVSCLGSRSWCGVLDETLFEQARNADIADGRIGEVGYGDHPRTVLDRDRYCYLKRISNKARTWKNSG